MQTLDISDKRLNFFYLVMASTFFAIIMEEVHATHVSEPIITNDPNAIYEMNQTISVEGWIKYDFQPASNVTVLLTVTNPNSDKIFQDEVKSNSSGNFTSSINLSELNLTDIGRYRITAESQCRDEHRTICNHNTTSSTLMLTN